MHADRFRPRRAFRTALSVAAAVILVLLALAAPSRADGRSAAIVYDVIAGEALYEDNADAERFPASLTKVMTIYIAFEELAAGNIKLDDQISMSQWASSRPPSKLGIKPGGTIKVRDAIKALVTKSANDVASALGEAIAGSESLFAIRMTKTAQRLGMSATVFKNASGLPNPMQRTTARDLAVLGLAVQRDFPQYYGVFQTRVFEFGKRRIGNHNRLLGSVEGVDGIKTGYINASGFNLVTSVRRDGKHLVAVVMGGATGGKRDARMRKLIATWLPKAQSGEPLLIAEWNDTPVYPVPLRRPSLATRFASRLKHGDGAPAMDDTLLAFAAETRAALGSDRIVAGARTTSQALQAVIAQADPAAATAFTAAPEPLPGTPAAVVAAFAQAPSLAMDAPAEGTDLGEVVEEVVLDVAAVQSAPRAAAATAPRFATAFAAFDAESDDALAVAVANIGAPAGASTISRGGVRVYVHRVAVIPKGRTTPVHQRLDLVPVGTSASAPPRPERPTVAPTRQRQAVAPVFQQQAAAQGAGQTPAQDVAAAGAEVLAHDAGPTSARTDAQPSAGAAPRPIARQRVQRPSRTHTAAEPAGVALALVGQAQPTRAEAAAAELAASGPATLPARWGIQVGAVPSRTGATNLLDELVELAPVLNKHARVTLPVATEGGTLYRARFAGFASEDDARAACQLFANHNRPCWAVSM